MYFILRRPDSNRSTCVYWANVKLIYVYVCVRLTCIHTLYSYVHWAISSRLMIMCVELTYDYVCVGSTSNWLMIMCVLGWLMIMCVLG